MKNDLIFCPEMALAQFSGIYFFDKNSWIDEIFSNFDKTNVRTKLIF